MSIIDETQGDLALINNRTHGEIFSENGEPRMEQGLGTAVFISLFSGPTDGFWGNELSNDPDEHYGGEFERLAESLDATVENALEMQEAIINDLQWMKNKGIAISIDVTSSIEDGDRILFDLTITRPEEDADNFRFSNNWTGQFANPSHIGIE